jgi:hypothetical protein
MAVLIEAYNIIVKDEVLELKPNLREDFMSDIPTGSYCTDGVIHRIGFMDPQFLTEYIEYLEDTLGLTYLNSNKKSEDFAVVEMSRGVEAPCDWLSIQRGTFFENLTQYENNKETFVIAWHKDNKEGILENYGCFIPEDGDSDLILRFKGVCFPYGWNPDRAITLAMCHHPDDLEEVERKENGVIVYRNKKTGELVYTGSRSETSTDNECDNKELSEEMYNDWIQKLQHAYRILKQNNDIESCEHVIQNLAQELEEFDFDENTINLYRFIYMLIGEVIQVHISQNDYDKVASKSEDLATKFIKLAHKTRAKDDYLDAASHAHNAAINLANEYIKTKSSKIKKMTKEMFIMSIELYKSFDEIVKVQDNRRCLGRFYYFAKEMEMFHKTFSELLKTFSDYRIIPDSRGDEQKHLEKIMDKKRMKRSLRPDLRIINYESAKGQYEYGNFLCELGDVEKGVEQLESALFIIGYLTNTSREMGIKEPDYSHYIKEIEDLIEKFNSKNNLK